MNRLYPALCLVALPLAAGEREALRYLENEVPRWRRENGCFSCHNNGDGARALFLAARAGLAVNRQMVEETVRFLEQPGAWDSRTLSLVQYAAALREALAAGLASRKEALAEAAARIAAAQLSDGHWKVDEESAPGSPVTYGPVLGTYFARVALEARAQTYRTAIEKANAWMAANQSRHVVDAAARVLALGRLEDKRLLEAAQAPNGSWNSEAFDTALAVLALDPSPAAARGRAWLITVQLEPGGWPGTTRPAGGPSYAQHISTSAWSLAALIRRNPQP